MSDKDNLRFGACSFGDFEVVKELQRSPQGAVFVCRFKYDGKLYALKERRVSEMGSRKNVMSEILLFQCLDHENILRCEGWFHDEKRKSLIMVLEYCECGDLHHLICHQKRLSGSRRYLREKYIWFLFSQICSGVKHLHSTGIVHRDLKSLNIMLKNKGKRIKIIDFGVSRKVSENTVALKTFYGTPLYLSPELVQNKPYNEKTDIWSLGVILYELTTLSQPFNGNSIMELARSITRGHYDPLPDHYSNDLSRVISWMLQIDPTKRPTISQLCDHLEKKKIFLENTDIPMYFETVCNGGELQEESDTDDEESHEIDVENKAVKNVEIQDNKIDMSKVESKPKRSSQVTAPLENSIAIEKVNHRQVLDRSINHQRVADDQASLSGDLKSEREKDLSARKQTKDEKQPQLDNIVSVSKTMPVAEDDVVVDVFMLQTHIRHERAKLRKLLQYRDYLHGTSHLTRPKTASTPSSSSPRVNSENNDRKIRPHVHSEIDDTNSNKEINDILATIAALELAIDRGTNRVPQFIYNKLTIPRQLRKSAEVEESQSNNVGHERISLSSTPLLASIPKVNDDIGDVVVKELTPNNAVHRHSSVSSSSSARRPNTAHGNREQYRAPVVLRANTDDLFTHAPRDSVVTNQDTRSSKGLISLPISSSSSSSSSSSNQSIVSSLISNPFDELPNHHGNPRVNSAAPQRPKFNIISGRWNS